MTDVRAGRRLTPSPPSAWWHRWSTFAERRLYRTGWPARVGRALGMPTAPHIARHTVSLRNRSWFPPALRIAYASDFHAGPTTHPALLAAACAGLRDARPDLLLLGGDFVESHAGAIDALVPLLREIPAPLGRLAVLGNHDWWTSPQHVVDALTAAGVEVLLNRNVQLPPPFEDIWVCGLDDHTAGTPDPDEALDGAEGMRIVLMHSPSNLLDLGGRRFELAICGHTHGGQIALPRGMPLVVAEGRLNRRFCRGRYELDAGGSLIVSVGLGCSLLPFRTFAHPEIVVCDVIGG